MLYVNYGYIYVHIPILRQMLDSTNDPIGDFYNAVAADVMTFGASQVHVSVMVTYRKRSHLPATWHRRTSRSSPAPPR